MIGKAKRPRLNMRTRARAHGIVRDMEAMLADKAKHSMPSLFRGDVRALVNEFRRLEHLVRVAGYSP